MDEEYTLSIRNDDLKVSPLISGRMLRARQLGLTPKHSHCKSYESNQSFPKIRITKSTSAVRENKHRNEFVNKTVDSIPIVTTTACHDLSDFNGNTYKEVNYTPNSNDKKKCRLIEYMSNLSICGTLPDTVKRNSRKAILTVNRKTTEILMVNRNACELLYFTSHELIGKRLDSLLKMMPNDGQFSCQENFVEDDGDIMEIAGLIMEVLSNGLALFVSVFVKSLPEEEGEVLKSIVVMESVNIMVAEVIFDSSGLIHQAEDQNVDIPLLGNCEALYGMNMNELIPDFIIPDSLLSREQMKHEYNITLNTDERHNLPAMLRLLRSEPHSVSFDSKNNGDDSDLIYLARITSFININGLITFTDDGIIHSINDGFARNLTGYTSKELIGTDICKLVPSMINTLENVALQGKNNNEIDIDDDGICLEKNNSNQVKSPFSENGSVESGVGKSTIIESSSVPLRGESSNVIINICPSSEDPQYHPHHHLANNLITPVISNTPIMKHYNSPANITGDVNHVPSMPFDLSEVMNRLSIDQMRANDIASGLSPTPRRTLSSIEDFANSPISKQNTPSKSKNHSVNDNISNSHVSSTPCVNKRLSIPNNTSNMSTPISNKYHSKLMLDLGSPLHHDRDSTCGYNTDYSLVFNANYGRNILLHKNGSEIDLGYLNNERLELKDSSDFLNCLWIGINNPVISSLSNNNLDTDLSIIEQASRTGNDLEMSITEDKEAKLNVVEDDSIYTPPKHCPYASEFFNLKSIGKGAFGFVRLAKRLSDQCEVVVKFINKKYVHDENWVNCDLTGKLIPKEAYMLYKLDHPNIVKILDLYESDKLNILVMEKHGFGFDLFELIDRKPLLDEPILSYLFRQVVNAVEYLHGKGILHRDIKDENIIVNHEFQVKLIDFGSSTYMPKDGELFSKFCGTFEYCSPEVINGHRYRGPELEMWTLGVTLYTLVYYENPFFDIEDTLKCQLNPPSTVSRELERLIFSLMEYSEFDRMTLSELTKSPWLKQEVDITKYDWNIIVPNNAFTDNLSFGDEFERSLPHY